MMGIEGSNSSFCLPAGFMLPSAVGRCRHMIASERSGELI